MNFYCFEENTLKRAKNTQPFGYLIKPFQARELNVGPPILCDQNKLAGSVIVFYDITERKKIEEEMLKNSIKKYLSGDIRI